MDEISEKQLLNDLRELGFSTTPEEDEGRQQVSTFFFFLPILVSHRSRVVPPMKVVINKD